MTVLPPDPLRDFDRRTPEQRDADRADFDRRYADAEQHHQETRRGLAEAQARLAGALERQHEDEDREIGS